MEDGRWRVEDGRWRVEDGRWRVGDGRWKKLGKSPSVFHPFGYQLPLAHAASGRGAISAFSREAISGFSREATSDISQTRQCLVMRTKMIRPEGTMDRARNCGVVISAVLSGREAVWFAATRHLKVER